MSFAARRASEQDRQALVEKVDAFIFDCDGMLRQQVSQLMHSRLVH